MDERTLNDLLECSVCLERLDTSSKVLPCQHTFCRKCLEVILSSRQELRCPECRILVDTKIEDLPPNVLLMRILEGMKNTATAAVAKNRQQRNQLEEKWQEDEYSSIQNDNEVENTIKLNDKQEQQQQINLKEYQPSMLLPYTQQIQQDEHQVMNLQSAQKLRQYQQIQQSQQQPHNSSIISKSAPQTHQQRRLVPHAYAIYDFDSNESNDLHFKRGDIILLKRRFDINWFVGEMNGTVGTFPANYVQVVVPLPSPQCVALYDFKMGPNEEEGCLTFKKGTIINVLRRVDHNWAEGRIDSMIGIFPIAFVELNYVAKQLLDSLAVISTPPPPPINVMEQQDGQNQQQRQQNVANNNNNCAVKVQSQQQHQHQQNHHQKQQQQQQHLLPSSANCISSVTTPESPLINSNSSSSSSQTSPNYAITNSSCSSSISGSSVPNSPNQSNSTSPQNASSIRFRDSKEKRHSLNALLTVSGAPSSSSTTNIAPCSSSGGPLLSIIQSFNRHSAEILSVPDPETGAAQNVNFRGGNESTFTGAVTTSASTTAPKISSNPQTVQISSGEKQTMLSRANVLKTMSQQSIPPHLPWGYLALYPYKPRKTDELELKKGCVYVVTERCLDGWFKGKNWQDISGVFPGNYVTPLRNRDQQQLIHQWKYTQNVQTPIQQTTSFSIPSSTQNKHLSGGDTAASVSAVATCFSHQPPELPPRLSPSSSPVMPIVSYTSTASATTATTALTSSNCGSSVWSKPLGQTVEALFSRKTHRCESNDYNEIRGSNAKDKDRDIRDKDNTSNAVASSTTYSASSAAVNLMKRLTHIKTRSKSPNNLATTANTASQHLKNTSATKIYAIDNLSFEDSTISGKTVKHISQVPPHSSLHPVHVRSGSCPSQLLQSLPVESQEVQQKNETTQCQQQQKQQRIKSQIPFLPMDSQSGGSQRVKGCKDRPKLTTNGRSGGGVIGCGVFTNVVPQQQEHHQQHHQKFMKCSLQAQQQQQHQHQAEFNYQFDNHYHRKTQSLDASAIECKTNQHNSKNFLETDRPPNTTLQKDAAKESRFRCVVSYPPNSEHELDLRVGDVVYVHRKQKNGWYKGTHARTNKTGLFPASFVEPDL